MREEVGVNRAAELLRKAADAIVARPPSAAYVPGELQNAINRQNVPSDLATLNAARDAIAREIQAEQARLLRAAADHLEISEEITSEKWIHPPAAPDDPEPGRCAVKIRIPEPGNSFFSPSQLADFARCPKKVNHAGAHGP